MIDPNGNSQMVRIGNEYVIDSVTGFACNTTMPISNKVTWMVGSRLALKN